MYKTIKADKDAYITNKLVKGSRSSFSNVGAAGTLDLFKIYGNSYSGSFPDVELSRILLHFDLSEIKELYSSKKIDVNDPSFQCLIKLVDVYGGQTTPIDFNIETFPLSASFSEGTGKDISFYSDKDACNWISSSIKKEWKSEGCGEPCANPFPGDYITSSANIPDTRISQYFKNGDENLVLDVTKIISSTLSGELPDEGFRISFSEAIEADESTYFVKRFASRTAYDESKRPKLIVKFDDSISDDTQNLIFDSPCSISLYNHEGGNLKNISSGSSLTSVEGKNCLKLKLVTEISGGFAEFYFSGSQFSYNSGNVFLDGIYQSSFSISSSDEIIKSKLSVSSSIDFVPVWISLDNSIAYFTGSILTMKKNSRSSDRKNNVYTLSAKGIDSSHSQGEDIFVKLHIFDQNDPFVKVTRLPVELPGVVVKNAYYQIRDVVTNESIVPYDDQKNSTKISSDSNGMFFTINTSCLHVGRTYVIDAMIVKNGVKSYFKNVSPVFSISGKDE